MDGNASFLAEASDAERSLANLALTASLMTVLAQKEFLNGEEFNFIASSAALACRGQGSERSAALIENMVPTSVGVDVEHAAAQLGMTMHKASAN